MNIQDKATAASRLRRDDAFQMLIKEVRDDAIAAFLESGPTDSEDREHAHQIIEALNQIDSKLQAWADAQTVADKKKGQHRGSD